MQPRPSDLELDDLLGRGTIGAARRDAIIQTVLVQAEAERRVARRRRWSVAGLGLTLVAAAASLLLVPRWASNDAAAFRPKGSSAPSTASRLALECVGGQPDACPAGSLLVVRVTGLRGYVSAWAEPVGGGERIWYYSADTYCPWIDGLTVPGAISSRAARVGAEHHPGTYAVEIRLTEKPMTRAELLQGAHGLPLASTHQTLTVVAR